MASFGSNTLYAGYGAKTSHRGISGAPWRKFSHRRIASGDSGYGYFAQIDFRNSGAISGHLEDGWFALADDVSISNNGYMKHVGATAADATTITSGGNVAGDFTVDTSGGKLLCFEAGFKKDTISTNTDGVFVGLFDPAAATATGTVLATGGELTDANYIGFHVDPTGTHVDVVYRKSGQTLQILSEDAFLLVDDTLVKCGFQFDPSFDNEAKIKFFINGDQVAVLTQTQIEAAVFPSATALAATGAVKKISGTGDTFIDFIAAGQEY